MRTRSTRRGRVLALATAAALLVAACTSDDNSSGEEPSNSGSATEETGVTSGSTDISPTPDPAAPIERGERLVIGGNGVASLQASQGRFDLFVAHYQALYDTLLRVEPDGTTVMPHLATDWSYDDARTTLTLTLRDDVTFSDGEPFDADAAVANLLRNRDDNGPNASFLLAMTDVVALDSTTVEITLSEPDPSFLGYLAHSAGLMQSPATFAPADSDSVPAGSGPYTLDSSRTVPGSEFTYVAREDYWKPDDIHYDEIQIRVITEPAALVNAIRAGEVDAANIAGSIAADVESVGWDLQTHELNWVGLVLVDRFGEMGSPLEDLRVRQALNHAFDREAILNSAGGGYGEVTGQVFRPESAGFDPALDELYPYDPERARELLADAGYPNGFTVSMPSTAVVGEAMYAIMADQLSDVGITVEYTDLAPAQFFTEMLKPSFPMFFMFLAQNPSDWTFINYLIAEDANWNPAHSVDDVTAELIEQIRVAEPGEESDELVAELGQHVAEDAWFAPWYRQTDIFGSDGETDAVLQAANNFPYLWNIYPQS